MGKYFFKRVQTGTNYKEIDTSDFIIIKSSSVFTKITIKRAKSQAIKRENIFATMFSKKGLNSIVLL